MITYDQAVRLRELDVVELGWLVAYYWPATIRWPRLTLKAAFAQADFWRNDTPGDGQ